MECFLEGEPKYSKILLPYMHRTSRKSPINYLQKAYRNFSDVIIKEEQKLTWHRTDKQEMKIFYSFPDGKVMKLQDAEARIN